MKTGFAFASKGCLLENRNPTQVHDLESRGGYIIPETTYLLCDAEAKLFENNMILALVDMYFYQPLLN